MAQVMDEGPGKRRPVDPMRHHRENGWDYKGRAIYHFTLPVEERFPLFGTLEGESAETAFVNLNPYGRRVCQMLCGLAQFYAGKGFALKVLAQKVMPDHVHLVIQVLEPLPQSIGAVMRGFKSGCTKVYKEMYGSGESAAEVHGNGENRENAAEVHGTGENEHKRNAEVPVHFARIFAGRGSIWEQNPAYYHERILHMPGQLRRMIDYVKDNPRGTTLNFSDCTGGRRRLGCCLRQWVIIFSWTGQISKWWRCREVLPTKKFRIGCGRCYWRHTTGRLPIRQLSVRVSSSLRELCVSSVIRWWCYSMTDSPGKGLRTSVTTSLVECISKRVRKGYYYYWNLLSRRS